MSRDDRPQEAADVRLAKLEAILSSAINAIVTIDSLGAIENINLPPRPCSDIQATS